MRSIYFNDQTKEFIERDFDIVFLGNLVLKGKPYTNPKEAVDKEYIDNLFGNITEKELVNTSFQPKNFPAFNGDLVNKAGQNNFLLKQVIKAGEYHKVTIDNRGRVIGGSTGKLKFTPADFGGVSYSKLTYDKYKNTNGVFGKPNKIADYTNGLNQNSYLYKAKDVIFTRPLRIDSGPVTVDNIINEDDMLKITDTYFKGEVSGVRQKDFNGYGDWGGAVSDNYDINMLPWKYQRSFNPNEGILINGSVEILQNRTTTVFPERVIFNNVVVYKNKLYNLLFNEDRKWAMDLRSDGTIASETFRKLEFSRTVLPDGFPLLKSERNIALLNNKLFRSIIYKREDQRHKGYYMGEYVVEGNDISIVSHMKRSTGHGGPFYNTKNGFIRFPQWDSPSALWLIDNNGYVRAIGLGGETNAIFFNDSDYGQVEAIGGFYYSFPINSSSPYLHRIRAIDGVPSGFWERYHLENEFPAINNKQFFSSKNHLYFASRIGSRLVIYCFDFNRNNGDLTNLRPIFDEDVDINSSVIDVFITKNNLYVYGSNFLIRLGYRGGLNDYGTQSMEDYIPPHP